MQNLIAYIFDAAKKRDISNILSILQLVPHEILWMTILWTSSTNFYINVLSCQHVICSGLSLISLSFNALSQHTAHCQSRKLLCAHAWLVSVAEGRQARESKILCWLIIFWAFITNAPHLFQGSTITLVRLSGTSGLFVMTSGREIYLFNWTSGERAVGFPPDRCTQSSNYLNSDLVCHWPFKMQPRRNQLCDQRQSGNDT